jgi:hypothetical protein
MSDLITGLVALLAAIPQAAAGASEAERERLMHGLDECKRGLTAIGPNAPTIHAAVERRLEELRTERGDEPTREVPHDLSMGPRPR